jgi:hypothetical protein
MSPEHLKGALQNAPVPESKQELVTPSPHALSLSGGGDHRVCHPFLLPHDPFVWIFQLKN